MLDLNNFVNVTNGTDKLIKARFDGEDYQFPVGKPVTVHIDAAAHMFGFGMDDKTAALARLGWAASSGDIDSALEKLGLVRFDDVEVKSQDQSPPASSACPFTPSGGTPGGGDATPPSGEPLDPEAGADL